MTTLPNCRWRIGHVDNLITCSSRKQEIGTRTAEEDLCQKCPFVDHEPLSDPVPFNGRDVDCIHLGNPLQRPGRRTDAQGNECQNRESWLTVCGLHGVCTLKQKRDGIQCCQQDCDEYRAKPAKRDWSTYFDRVVVINLKRRPDRLEEFWKGIDGCDWPFKRPEVFEAVDGSEVPCPEGWESGGGAWGCIRSHSRLLELAIMASESILILEDDAKFLPNFRDHIDRFLSATPNDWDQLMIGGQHHGPTKQMSPGIVRCSNCQRTHCYAIRGRMMHDLYAKWHASHVHCDWVMGPFQAEYRVYAPEPFIVGQARMRSDINGDLNPAKFWNPPTGQETILLLDCPREVVDYLRENHRIHTGYNRDWDSGIDVGLRDLFAEMDPSRFSDWIRDLMWEVVSEPGSILGVWHPEATEAAVKACWSGPVRVVKARTAEEAIAQLASWKGATE